MKQTEYKELVSVLALFASARESAKGSDAFIGVQVSGGKAKLIAGSAPAGVIVTLDGEYEGKYGYTVDARPFIQSAKVITGKQEVTINVAESGITVETSAGGKIFLKADGTLRDAGFPKKPKDFLVKSTIQGAQFPQLAKLFDTIIGDYEIEAPSLENTLGMTHFVAVTPVKEKRAMYAHLEVASEGAEGYYAAAYGTFWRSLKHFDADGVIEWGEDGVLAVSGPYELYSTPYRVSPYDRASRKSESPRNPEPWPIMGLNGEPSVACTVDKKNLVEALRGVMPNDEHGRVVLSVKEGELNLAAFGAEGGMTIPADTKKQGHRACDANLLIKFLRAMDGKRVTIGWAQQPAMIISSPEMAGWTLLLAPIALSGGD